MALGKLNYGKYRCSARSTPAALERTTVAVAVLLAVCTLFLTAGCTLGAGARLTPGRVLVRSVDKLLSLKSYRYCGTSSLKVAGNPTLDNTARFTTELALNGASALDGHMVVDSPGGGSYETYTCGGARYTRVEGGDWSRVDNDPGMVSADARRVIARFGDLVDSTRLDSETADDYTISFSMGKKYWLGASSIVGFKQGNVQSSTPGLDVYSNPEGKTDMTITVDKATMQMKRVLMTVTTPGTSGKPEVAVTTNGTYSGFNAPVSVKPPPEALRAAELK